MPLLRDQPAAGQHDAAGRADFELGADLRLSRSSLVNTRHVREIDRTPRGDFVLELAGGTTMTSSEGRRDAVREYLETLRVAASERS
jgi:hypothetical protein